MRRSILPAVLCAITFTAPLLADPPAPAISRLQVVKKVSNDLDVTLFSKEGVGFVIQLVQPGQNILGVDENASKLTSAVDDKGTDLTEDTSDWISSFFSHISKNRQKIAIPIQLGTLPADGATSIAFKANIGLMIGSGEKTDTIKSIDLAVGTSASYGKHTITIKKGEGSFSFGDKKNKDEKQNVSVNVNDGGRWLKSIVFVDAAGKELDSKAAGSSGSNDSLDQDYTLDADAKIDSARVVYFDKVDKVDRAIDMKISIGLGK